jgi:cellulose biosynthesis protein BcsQ
VSVLPWDELQGDAAAFLHSERVLDGIIHALEPDIDIVLIDYPGESGPLLTNALMASTDIIIPIVAETPALEGVESMLRLMARVRAAGHPLTLAGILLTRCEPKNRRAFEIVQTILQAGDVEGESLGRKLLPFAIRQNEFFEQAFRYGEPVWERSSNPSHWAGYVLMAEWLLRQAGLDHLALARRGPALLSPDVRVLSISGLLVDEPDVSLSDFEVVYSTLGR